MAFPILHRRDLVKARRRLTRARTDFGLPVSVRFHGATHRVQGEDAIATDRTKAVDRLIQLLPDDRWTRSAIDHLRHGSFRKLHLRLHDRPPARQDNPPVS